MKEWKQDFTKQISANNKRNVREVEEQKKAIEDAKNASNPWVRVVDNCEMNKDQYVGDKDVSRMREAMISRKADINKQGGMPK